jgi:EpsI family protein
VARACAGVRFLIASVALGTFVSNLFFHSLRRRVCYIIFSIAVPILANGLRAFGIVMIAHFSGMKYAAGADHLIYGYVFLSFVIVTLLIVALVLREKDGFLDLDHQPATRGMVSSPTLSLPHLIFVGGAVIAVTLGAYGLSQQRNQDVFEVDVAAIQRAISISTASPVQSTLEYWTPAFVGADAEYQRSFEFRGQVVDLYIAFYSHQRDGAEVISSNNETIGLGWWQVDTRLMPAAIGESELQLRETRIVAKRGQRIVWSWYWIDGTFTTSPYLAKLLEARSKLTGGDPRAAFIAISTELLEDLDSTDSLLHEFLGAMAPLDQALAGVGSLQRRPKDEIVD